MYSRFALWNSSEQCPASEAVEAQPGQFDNLTRQRQRLLGRADAAPSHTRVNLTSVRRLIAFRKA